MSGTTSINHDGSKLENDSSNSEQAQQISKEALGTHNNQVTCEQQSEREEKPAASMAEERSVELLVYEFTTVTLKGYFLFSPLVSYMILLGYIQVEKLTFRYYYRAQTCVQML